MKNIMYIKTYNKDMIIYITSAGGCIRGTADDSWLQGIDPPGNKIPMYKT